MILRSVRSCKLRTTPHGGTIITFKKTKENGGGFNNGEGWSLLTNVRFVNLLRSNNISNGSQFNRKKGFALEDAFLRSSGLERRTGLYGPFRVRPDAMEIARYMDLFHYPDFALSIIYEVKATQEIKLTDQIKGEILAAASARLNNSDFTAKQAGISEFILVTFADNLQGQGFQDILLYATEHNVRVSAVIPLINDNNEIKFIGTPAFNGGFVQPRLPFIGIYIPAERMARYNRLLRAKVQINFSATEKGPWLPGREFLLTNEDGLDY